MTKEQIDQMVNAFLCWKIPQTFNPDCHISFAPKPDYHGNPPTWPVGTNLFSYTEAKAMVEHMVAALTPPPSADAVALVDALDVSEQTILELVCAVEREDNWYSDGAFGKQKHVREHVRRAKEACDKARAAAAIRALADKETQSNG